MKSVKLFKTVKKSSFFYDDLVNSVNSFKLLHLLQFGLDTHDHLSPMLLFSRPNLIFDFLNSS